MLRVSPRWTVYLTQPCGFLHWATDESLRGVGLAVGELEGVGVGVGELEGARVTAAVYSGAGSVGLKVGAEEDVGRTGDGVGDGSGIVAVAVEPV